ncbi:hypothetical protein JOD54_005606 [Actinokineospora baliensis]|uniref:hypothetical protein n=1 Tax=Actinokineospora baliensis TaxID=547056 RepID=UPI00195A5C26|nr:hypothetical protein [Actinokineospora baliensis]MBM7775402.1 hypothetical protein [Actinokineospora baliensis]
MRPRTRAIGAVAILLATLPMSTATHAAGRPATATPQGSTRPAPPPVPHPVQVLAHDCPLRDRSPLG